MPVKKVLIGTSKPQAVYVGTSKVKLIYIGTTLVYTDTLYVTMLAYYKEQLVTAEQLRKELKELGVVETRTSMDESYGISYHDYNGVKFTITYSKLELQHKQETHNLFSRFLIMPSGEIGVNGIEKR